MLPRHNTVPYDHVCPGCGLIRVPNTQLACPACWLRLPVEIRAVVDRTYRFRATQAEPWRRAIARALAWYRDNPQERTEAEQEPS